MSALSTRRTGSNQLRAQESSRLNLRQKGVDFLLALQRIEPAIDAVAQHLPFGSPQSFFAGDFGPHAFEGTVLSRREGLSVGGAAHRPRAAVLIRTSVKVGEGYLVAETLIAHLLDPGFEAS